MARNLLFGTEAATAGLSVATRSQARTTPLSAASLDSRLRQKRSPAYVQAMTRVDVGGHLHDRQALAALKQLIDAELGEIALEDRLLGIVSRCMLGHPYEVHTLDLTGQIIEHFKIGHTLPLTLERARTLALHPSYAFIEVYANRMVTVSDSGQTAVIEGTT